MIADQRPSVWHLFVSFLRLGLTAFGGPSMVAYIRTMAVEKQRWLDDDTFKDGVALCQMIPGATAMQTAAYVGLKTRGVVGAAASFVGFGFPAFVLMMTLAAVYTHTHDMPVVVSTFSGLQAVIVAIVANATIAFGKTTVKGWRTASIAGMAAALFALNTNPLAVIGLAAVGGFALVKPKGSSQQHCSSSAQGVQHTKPLLVMLLVSALGFALLFLLDRAMFRLAILMFRIDLTAFGGGFASVPLMQHEIVNVRNWMDSQTFMNGIALGQITPGPIVITATFIGYVLMGPVGGAVATMGVFLPSFMMVIGISPWFDRLRSSPSFNKAIRGVLCSFVGLLLTVTIRFGTNVHWDWTHVALGSGALVALLLKADIIWVVSIGIALSALLCR